MKYLAILLLSFSVFAQNKAGFIPDFNYQVTDVASIGVKKEKIFASLLRENVYYDAICANKAHVWSWQMSKKYNIQTGKIFMFYTAKIWEGEPKGYWYHVAPYIVENGVEYVMEAAYPDEVTRPLTVNQWLEEETDGRWKASACREITSADKDLSRMMFERINFPDHRPNGKGADCYFRKVPEAYQYPGDMALHDLGHDEAGNRQSYNPTTMIRKEVYDACVEATAGKKWGIRLPGDHKTCKRITGF